MRKVFRVCGVLLVFVGAAALSTKLWFAGAVCVVLGIVLFFRAKAF